MEDKEGSCTGCGCESKWTRIVDARASNGASTAREPSGIFKWRSGKRHSFVRNGENKKKGLFQVNSLVGEPTEEKRCVLEENCEGGRRRS